MGKSSGGGGGGSPTGSQTIIQDIAEPFKGFATRSLQRAEDLQGLPSIPFTGIATAPPSPDELVAAQALRNRFLEGQPLTEEALALQSTAADPITAASIQARQNPFEAQIAQEAYRRLDQRAQGQLQSQRAREVQAGGTDRGRGAIEDSLIRQEQQDQERQIGLEAGQRAFTDASRLAIADRQARADTAAGINARLGERQSMGRRDIDDLLRVGAQFREKFVQPELNLERQQFSEHRGPAATQNPFGFEQFFSGIRASAPTPTVATQQNFKQTPSGLSQGINTVGGVISAGDQLGAFEAGGPITFHEGGVIEHQRAGHAHQEQDPGAIMQVIKILQEQGHLVKGPQGRMEFMIRMQSDPSFKPLFEQAMSGVVENSGWVDPTQESETVVEEATEQTPRSRETGRSEFDAMVDTHGQLAKGFTDVQQPESKSAQEQPGGYGLLGSGDKPRGMITEKRALERLAAQERVSGIEAAALARAEEEMRNRTVSPVTTQDQNFIPQEQKARLEAEENLKFHHDVEAFRNTQPDQARVRNKFTAPYMVKSLANLGEGEEFPESTSAPDMDEGSAIGMAPLEEAPAEYWAESMKDLPKPVPPTPSAEDFDEGFATGMDRIPEAVEGRAPYNELPEMVQGRAVSSKASEPQNKYTDSEITAMMEFSMSGRGRERLPKEMFGLDTLEVHDALKPIRERARKASEPRRAQERRDRIANRRGFGDRGGIKDSDTPSYDITLDDVKELFNFKGGGIASYKKGGFADFFDPTQGDPITRMIAPDLHAKLQEFKGPFNQFEPEEEEKPAHFSIEEWQEYQRKRHAQQTAELDIENRRANTKFKADSGLSSLNQGGIARFNNGEEVIVSENWRSEPQSTLYGRPREQRDQDNKDATLGMMKTEERDPKNPQEVAEFMRKGFGRWGRAPGYPSRTLGLRQREKYERGQRAVEDLAASQQVQETQPEGSSDNDSAMGAQLSNFLKMYEDSLNEKLTKGYSDEIPLSKKQKRKGLIGAIAAAMMAVRSDESGGTDFSRAGPAAAAHVANFRGGLEKTKKEEIAARAAHRDALLKGVTTSAEVFKDMSAGEKDRASAALDIIKAKYPDLELYKIVTPELMKAVGSGMMDIEQLQGAVEEAVASLRAASGQSSSRSGSVLENVDIEGVLAQSPSE
tara:strand:+ start:1496 stop:4957 length:3462 start_codon:yes stop_codon:yes gene_type:complete